MTRSIVFVGLLLALVLPGCLDGGGSAPDPAPEVEGTWAVVSYAQGFDCDNPGDPVADVYATVMVSQRDVGSSNTLDGKPCDAMGICGPIFGGDGGLYYQGGDRWEASSRTAFNTTSTTCRLERELTTADLQGDGTLEIHVKAYGSSVPYTPVLNPCKLEKVTDDLPCESHEVFIAAPM